MTLTGIEATKNAYRFSITFPPLDRG